MAPRTVLIKKYENRRLYNATDSRYVNLDDVAAMVQRGDEVRVIDVATGDDITRLVLTQIIVEGAKTPESGFPLDFLRDMVIASGRASQESALHYTRAMLDLYKSTYRAMTPAFNPFDFMQGGGTGSRETPAESNNEAEKPQEAAPNETQVRELQARLAELEKMVSSMTAKKRPPKAPARKSRRQSS